MEQLQSNYSPIHCSVQAAAHAATTGDCVKLDNTRVLEAEVTEHQKTATTTDLTVEEGDDIISRNFPFSANTTLQLQVPAGSPSRGGDVTVYVLDISQPSLPTPLILLLCLFRSL